MMLQTLRPSARRSPGQTCDFHLLLHLHDIRVDLVKQQSRFTWMTTELHEQILHLEAHIEELADVIERCRKIIVISKAAIAAGGTLILAITLGAVRFDPTVMIG